MPLFTAETNLSTIISTAKNSKALTVVSAIENHSKFSELIVYYLRRQIPWPGSLIIKSQNINTTCAKVNVQRSG